LTLPDAFTLTGSVQQLLILGTGLIGTSTGLALKAAGFKGRIAGFDMSAAELAVAQQLGAIDDVIATRDAALEAATRSDVILLATPVFAILDWMERLAPLLKEHQLVTDVGSTKLQITQASEEYLYNSPGRACFLPGHPMAGKESGGAALAEARLLDGATWLFTPGAQQPSALEQEWREWVGRFGCRTLDLDPARHDVVCAWVSHLPQMVSTAMASLLEEEFLKSPEAANEFFAIGGRALREMTRLGASPYSMWRDVALSNTVPLSDALLALEQQLAHLRENLKTPELREQFTLANRFHARR
jgi:prephenate dehydrogenase